MKLTEDAPKSDEVQGMGHMAAQNQEKLQCH